MLAEAIYGGILVGAFIYHRVVAALAEDPKPPNEITLPRVDEGAAYPLIYGRCRVRQPVLAWAGTPRFRDDGPAYLIPAFFLLGIPFLNGTNKLYSIWVGDLRLATHSTGLVWGGSNPPAQDIADLEGNGAASSVLSPGGFEQPGFASNIEQVNYGETGAFVGGSVEFLSGDEDQLMASGSTSLTMTAQRMTNDYTHLSTDYDTGTVSVDEIPDYRRRLGVFLSGQIVTESAPGISGGYRGGWSFGAGQSVPAVSFEVSSYPEGTGLSGTRTINSECNPADVIYDLLTDDLKLGIPHANVDFASFEAAAITLLAEAHGYSRAIEDVRDADEHIHEILKQIDATLYVDPRTLKWTIKLIRGDYNPLAAPRFTPENCRVSNWSLRGHTNIPNKIRVIFEDRQEHYSTNSATAHNEANAVGQSGQVEELVLQMPGIKTMALAQMVAERELMANSRPIARCRISTGREYAHIVPGDAVVLTIPELGVSNMAFRAAAVDRGSLETGQTVVIDVIQDLFYVHRNVLSEIEIETPGLPAHRD